MAGRLQDWLEAAGGGAAKMSAMTQEVDRTVLRWLEDAVGPKLLAYLLGCDLDSLLSILAGDHQPSDKQMEVISAFSRLHRGFPRELDVGTQKELVRTWLVQVENDGRSVARSMHEHADGIEEIPSGEDELERALLGLVVDAFPAFLLPPDSIPMPPDEDISFRLSSLLHNHPQAAAFSEAALSDPVLQRIFAEENPNTGRTAMIYRNTGSGSGVQLSMLPDTLLRAAWRRLRDGDPSPRALADEAIKELRLSRDLLAGKTRAVPAKLAFAGILLPSNSRLDLRDGVVRPATDADRRVAPEPLKGRLSGTDASGNSTTINYDGDVILEYKFPYKVRVEQLSQSLSPLPEGMYPPPSLERTATWLRFSLMLAVEREPRAQLVPTWRYFDEPLSQGSAISWNDPRQGTGIMPTQLSDAEVTAWGEWYERLSNATVGRIELALSRILRAIAERREPSDTLIDSIIAWENLFGSKEGELRFRITSSLAVLLKESYQERKGLKKKLTDLYDLRSKVVHGSRNLKHSEYPQCQAALSIAIEAIRVLIGERPDLLELPDGTERSTALLLQESPDEKDSINGALEE
jgi:Apea-like HEPN